MEKIIKKKVLVVRITLVVLLPALVAACTPGMQTNLKAEKAFTGGRYSEAAHLYQQAISEGNPQALCNLGGLYRSGRGVTANQQTALSLFIRCIESSGDNIHLKGLGYFLAGIVYVEHGNASQQQTGWSYINTAARLNNHNAKKFLANSGRAIPIADLYNKYQANNLAFVLMMGVLANSKAPPLAYSNELAMELDVPSYTSPPTLSNRCMSNGECDPGQQCFVTPSTKPYGVCQNLVDSHGQKTYAEGNVPPVMEYQCRNRNDCPVGFICKVIDGDSSGRGYCSKN